MAKQDVADLVKVCVQRARGRRGVGGWGVGLFEATHTQGSVSLFEGTHPILVLGRNTRQTLR